MTRRQVIVFGLAFLLVAAGHRPPLALADGVGSSAGTSIVEQIGCDTTENSRACQIQDFINLFVYLSKWGLSILVALSMLMFLYGGFQFLTAGGRPSKIDEGKRVITGTVVGITIALTAYVIINFTVSAVSGFTIPSGNPFGPVGAVFSKTDISSVIQGQTTLQRPFSGSIPSGGSSSATSGPPACARSGTWDTSCVNTNLQVDCADPASGGGSVFFLQKTLQAKGCDCKGVDGCFGPKTVACVRQFQIANLLPPTGVVDVTTNGKLATGVGCGVAGNQDTAVAGLLPAPIMSTASGGDSGCCIVKSGNNELYCANKISSRACQALGADNTFVPGVGSCGEPGDTAGHCGFCSDGPVGVGTKPKCFQTAGPYWCSNNSLTFNFGNCTGVCGSCTSTQLVTPI